MSLPCRWSGSSPSGAVLREKTKTPTCAWRLRRASSISSSAARSDVACFSLASHTMRACAAAESAPSSMTWSPSLQLLDDARGLARRLVEVAQALRLLGQERAEPLLELDAVARRARLLLLARVDARHAPRASASWNSTLLLRELLDHAQELALEAGERRALVVEREVLANLLAGGRRASSTGGSSRSPRRRARTRPTRRDRAEPFVVERELAQDDARAARRAPPRASFVSCARRPVGVGGREHLEDGAALAQVRRQRPREQRVVRADVRPQQPLELAVLRARARAGAAEARRSAGRGTA